MARYISDQNKVLLIHESGTYANSSGPGHWIGEVTENSLDDAEGKLENRYLGTSTRSFDSIEQGPRDATGTLTYNAQNFRFPFWAIGSVTDGSSGASTIHTATQINSDSRQSAFTSGPLNPPVSFTLEDSKQSVGTGRNFIRTINGAIPTNTTITATQGEKVTVEMDYLAQTVIASSGTTTAVTQDTIKPYLWDSSTITLAGSVLQTVKEAGLEINQNTEGPHYLNGSRDISVPFQGNRIYTFNLTMDLDGTEAGMLYNEFYKGGSSFNLTWDMNQDIAAGSQHAIFRMSGCEIFTMDNPSTNEGLTETTIEIRPQDIDADEYTSTTSTFQFNPF